MTSNYEIKIRNQYTFIVTPRDLAIILTQNVALYTINIIGLCIIHTSDNLLLVKIVVGSEADELADLEQNENFRHILVNNRVCFSQQKLLQIMKFPGQIRIVYTSLICNNIPIIALYFGERNNVIFIEVPTDKIMVAEKIIADFPLNNAEENLCINLKNCFPGRSNQSNKFTCVSDNR